ncbi:hypothetical protein [Ureaplasma ceti]|uniref:Uncharacterized protein n=1 Tax=Ureaplasma ceti TaxID=3119530 RepID=A0ABP9U5B7_9BACT
MLTELASSVNQALPHLSTHWDNAGWSGGLAFIGWFSSIVIFLAYFPGTIRIIMNHQTFFLSSKMWILTMAALLAFVIYGGLLGGQAKLDGWGNGAIASGYSLVIFDGISFILCGIILCYKIHNQKVAKQTGITEQQVCEDFLKNYEKIHHKTLK